VADTRTAGVLDSAKKKISFYKSGPGTSTWKIPQLGAYTCTTPCQLLMSQSPAIEGARNNRVAQNTWYFLSNWAENLGSVDLSQSAYWGGFLFWLEAKFSFLSSWVLWNRYKHGQGTWFERVKPSSQSAVGCKKYVRNSERPRITTDRNDYRRTFKPVSLAVRVQHYLTDSLLCCKEQKYLVNET